MPKLTAVSTSSAPSAIGPYSQAVAANGFLYVSGQIPLDPVTGKIAEGGIEAQAHQSLKNVSAILNAAGLTCADVVKTTVLLTDINDFAAVNAVYAQYFTQSPMPARAAFAVKALPKGAAIEIEAVAAL
ncbi:MAG: RidA family protein [Eubacteriales bacterium]|jgi:2-iminobutanoate/2-iminopropanoate deaminase